jgi:hypothetical protein
VVTKISRHYGLCIEQSCPTCALAEPLYQHIQEIPRPTNCTISIANDASSQSQNDIAGASIPQQQADTARPWYALFKHTSWRWKPAHARNLPRVVTFLQNSPHRCVKTSADRLYSKLRYFVNRAARSTTPGSIPQRLRSLWYTSIGISNQSCSWLTLRFRVCVQRVV